VGRRAIDADHARAALTSDGVRLQPGAVGHIHDGHKLTGKNVGSIKQVQVNGD
jgi:hypothetical protein